jgi:hypothetical protein
VVVNRLVVGIAQTRLHGPYDEELQSHAACCKHTRRGSLVEIRTLL